MTQKHISNMTRKEFLEVPPRCNWASPEYCTSVVVVPTRRMHDSGFRCMIVVACMDGYPVARVTECSDVINLKSYDYCNSGRMIDVTKIPYAWNVECLRKSGLLNFWTNMKLEVECAVSSLGINGYLAQGASNKENR